MDNKMVYKAIAVVTGLLSKEGISKDRKNQQQNYAFRGIDDVYNALAPFLAEAQLCILPRVMERSVTERETAKGGTLFYVVLKVEFDFVSAVDGSLHTVVMYGEAMDSGDKATNKAMSAAYKYACMQAFCIPTEGDNDADAHTHTVKKPEPAKEIAEKVAAKAGVAMPDIPDALIPIFDEISQPGHVTSALGEMKQRFVASWPNGHGETTFKRICTAHRLEKGKMTIGSVKLALIEMHNILKSAPEPVIGNFAEVEELPF